MRKVEQSALLLADYSAMCTSHLDNDVSLGIHNMG